MSKVPSEKAERAAGERAALTKADYLLLEKVFAGEIDSALGDMPPMQTRSKRIFDLEKHGLVQRDSMTLKGRFPVRIDGWCMTHYGRYLYCQWAGGQSPKGRAK